MIDDREIFLQTVGEVYIEFLSITGKLVCYMYVSYERIKSELVLHCIFF